MVQADCEVTFKQQEKNIFWFVLSQWPARPSFGRPHQSQKITSLCWSSWEIRPAEYWKKKLTLLLFAVLFNLFSTQWYKHTHRKIFFSYLKSGYIIPEKILLLSFLPPLHRFIMWSEYNTHTCYQVRTQKRTVSF